MSRTDGEKKERFTSLTNDRQLYNTLLLAFCAHIIFINIVANNPRVRAILTPSGGLYTSSPRNGPIILAIATIIPCVGLLAGIAPAIARLVNCFVDISALYDEIMQGIKFAESVDSLEGLRAGPPLVEKLQKASRKSSDVLTFTGRFYGSFIAFWLIVSVQSAHGYFSESLMMTLFVGGCNTILLSGPCYT